MMRIVLSGRSKEPHSETHHETTELKSPCKHFRRSSCLWMALACAAGGFMMYPGMPSTNHPPTLEGASMRYQPRFYAAGLVLATVLVIAASSNAGGAKGPVWKPVVP